MVAWNSAYRASRSRRVAKAKGLRTYWTTPSETPSRTTARSRAEVTAMTSAECPAARSAQQLEAVAVGQVEVEQDQVDGRPFEQAHGGGPGVGDPDDGEAVDAAGVEGMGVGGDGIVLDDEHPQGKRGHETTSEAPMEGEVPSRGPEAGRPGEPVTWTGAGADSAGPPTGGGPASGVPSR